MALAAALVVLALFASTAQADVISETAKAGRFVDKSDNIAHVYWAHRGHPFAPGVRYRVFGGSAGVLGRSDIRQRIVYLNVALVDGLLYGDLNSRRWGAREGCNTIVHETGHITLRTAGHRTGFPAIDDYGYDVPACVQLSLRGV